MRRLLVTLAASALALAGLAAPGTATTDPRQVQLTLTKTWGGLDQPLVMTYVPGETSRTFVVERPGRIRVIRNGVLKPTPFLDISKLVDTEGEGGLLGLAFRPDFRTSGYFFVTFTDFDLTLHVVRYHADPNSDVASPATGSRVLLVPHPGFTNHNAGELVFGPSGLLYISTGDGGGSGTGNAGMNSQNALSLLGKILRIDVTHVQPGHLYAIPKGNPYTYATHGQRKEIWLLGLRNPWRFSFDRARPYDLWIGDVGQGAREEVDRVTKGGLNMGWDCREGTLNTGPGGSPVYGGSYCKSTGYTAPVFEYDHTEDCAIIGGFVYRGQRYASLLGGTYLYGDWCTGRIWGLGPATSTSRVNGELARLNTNVLAFGEVANGELYVLAGDGGIYRVAASHKPAPANG
jgi:glucose/arabinose dehydrogenase